MGTLLGLALEVSPATQTHHHLEAYHEPMSLLSSLTPKTKRLHELLKQGTKSREKEVTVKVS